MSIPAFILGNGPDLPADDLRLLDGYFTVGVNRIPQVYDPTCNIVLDGRVATDIDEFMPQRQCIRIGTDERGNSSDCDCKLHLIQRVYAPSPDAWTLHGVDNSAVTAAYWCAALKCEPIYLLGCSGVPRGELTNHERFRYGQQYGKNPEHSSKTTRQFKRSFAALVGSGLPVSFIATPAELRSVLCYFQAAYPDYWRAWLRNELARSRK